MKWASHFLGAALLTLLATASAADPFTIVLDGLQSPRGLSFGPDGRLYVAQAGSGGASSKITEIRYPWLANPGVRDLVKGLISLPTAKADSSVRPGSPRLATAPSMPSWKPCIR